MRKSSVAAQPGLDFTAQDGFSFAPLDLGPAATAICPKGHHVPAGLVGCPVCVGIENERMEREKHQRKALEAARDIRQKPDAPVFAVGVAGTLHLIAAAGEKKAFCGEIVNTKYVMRKTREDLERGSGAYCAACRGYVGL